jgi:hypothetical protein
VATMRICISMLALSCMLGCGTDDGGGDGGATSSASSGNGSGGGGGGEGGGAASTSSRGSGGGAPSCLRDACEAHADRQTCCADAECGWHQTGHVIHGIPQCVSKERVCKAGDRTIRECPSGTTCIVEGASQETEDDCTPPPAGQIYLPGRGLCGCR